MIKTSYIFCLLLLFSCDSGVEVETVSLEDLLPQSSYPKDTITKIEEKKDSLSKFRTDLAHALGDSMVLFTESEKSVKLFPDRLTNVSREQEQIILNLDTISITFWEFSDSLTTINAFYNWLDCFGDNCTEVKIGDEVNFSKKHILTLVSNYHLIYLESNTGLNMSLWEQDIIPSIFSQDQWIYGISQLAKRKAKWHIYKL